MISTIFHSQGMIALISIVFLLACRVIAGLNPIMDQLNPASMSKYAMETLVTGRTFKCNNYRITNYSLDFINTLRNVLLDC